MKNFIKNLCKIRCSYESANAAFNKVRRELFKLGMFTDAMDEVEAEWQQFAVGALLNIEYFKRCGLGKPNVMGFCTAENRVCIPEFVLGRDCSILDVMRHEFGHACANAYPEIFASEEFKRAFGNKYGDFAAIDAGKWKEFCVSEYAAESTEEDFAETFMYYLKHKGKIPKAYGGNKHIKLKWKFIERLAGKISR